MTRIFNKLSYANVVSSICLFVVLGGSAYAAATISGKNIKDNSVTSADIKNKTLLANDFKPGQLPKATGAGAGQPGPQGPKGDAGAPGAAGDPGQAGPQGERGPQGEPGKDGKDGKDGPTARTALPARRATRASPARPAPARSASPTTVTPTRRPRRRH